MIRKITKTKKKNKKIKILEAKIKMLEDKLENTPDKKLKKLESLLNSIKEKIDSPEIRICEELIYRNWLKWDKFNENLNEIEFLLKPFKKYYDWRNNQN